MPKEFSTWVSEMSNSIEDASGFIKPSYDITTLTSMQRRMHIADLLVPNIETEDDVDAWLTAFCVALDRTKLSYTVLIDKESWSILGWEEHNAYLETDGDTQSKAWLHKVKQKIISGSM